jgi:cysteine-rich repeat protein
MQCTAWALALACSGLGCYDEGLLDPGTLKDPVVGPGSDAGASDPDGGGATPGRPRDGGANDGSTPSDATTPVPDAAPPVSTFDPLTCEAGECWWSRMQDGCRSAGAPRPEDRPSSEGDGDDELGDIYLGWSRIRLGSSAPDGSPSPTAWQGFGLDLDGVCTNSSTCSQVEDAVSCRSVTRQIPYDGELCRDNTFASLQPIAAQVPEIGGTFGISEDVFNCELWHGSYNVIMRVSGYNGRANDSQVRVDFYVSGGLERQPAWRCPLEDYRDTYPLWRTSATWTIDEDSLSGPIEEAGTLPDSTIADPNAYVRQNYLVARLPDGALLRLAGDGQPYRGFPLVVQQGLWIGHLLRGQDGTWTVRDGLAAGRTRKEDLIRSFREVGFCPGLGLDPFYDAMVNYVNENADVLAGGEVDPETDCDAISLGIAFEASQITPGSAVALDPLVECCPPGVTLEQCLTVCGDGEVTGDEHCDTAIDEGAGACPTACAPLDACTPQVRVGEGCATRCDPREITDRVTGDGCCPYGANATEDGDCPSICGNGVVEPGETCDPSSSCPETCTTTNACLMAVAAGSAGECTATCTLVPVTTCTGGDGCCPDGCSQANDSDCSAACGDRIVDPSAGETCEPNPLSGRGPRCPSSCDDGNACTTDVRTGSSANCNVVCTHTAITQPQNGDGCCPPGANANNDSDCSPVCGNGVREGTELCDGNCPTSCNDGIACTADTVTGTACNRRCTFTDITTPQNGDGCCPPGAHANNDDDCAPVCGNGEVEPGELCDDGNTVSNDGCSSTCQVEADQAMCLSLLGTNTACSQCTCLDCRPQAVACYGSSSADANARCEAMVACGRENDCSGADCYCGTIDDFTCIVFGIANGPCRPQVEAAAYSTDRYVILSRSSNTDYPLGRANALATCVRAECASECGL